ncbi:hypothetical protein BC629DRAFT_1440928 [Irpex lacteus]|nr:hypothetical protein BC629DRAFT_1440928 [Irpex lacteus]
MTSLTKDLPPLPPDPAQEDTHKTHPGVFRRLTSKLRSPSQQWVHVASPHEHGDLECVPEEAPSSPKKDKHKRKASGPLLGLSTTTAVHRKVGVELENAFTSAEQRQAALRAVGLVPANAKPGRDAHGYKAPLSEQEAQLDKYFATAPAKSPEQQESEAQKIKEAWMRKNTEAGVVDGGSGSGSGSRAASRSPERVRLSPELRWEPTVVVEEPKPIEKVEKPLMTADQVRARRKDDPVFAPSGLLAAMQAYRPENYRPPPSRKPSGASAMQQRRANPDSDTDSE